MGTDINIYKPKNIKHNKLTFFHSVGMSLRKGTDILIDAFIDGKIYEHSELVIHTQIPIENNCCYTKEELKRYNIKIIEKTVTAPGLYHMRDIYVYPTRLDGPGLTMYEALASGMPLITSDFPPMNEFGSLDFIKYVKIQNHYCRKDAYYYPMVICEKDSLIEAMMWYVNHPESLENQKLLARVYAEKNYTISETTVCGIVSMKKSKIQIVVAAGACITNIIMNTFLVPRYGCQGAAISTGISYIVFLLCAQYFLIDIFILTLS